MPIWAGIRHRRGRRTSLSGTTMGATMNATDISPGWYPDPSALGHIRFWDGIGWTEHTAAPLPATTVPMAPGALGLPVIPRTPRRRLPLPAFFVVGTVLIGFPLAITIGVFAAHASAPPPLEIPVQAEEEDPADAAAKDDAAAIRSAIGRYYQQTNAATPPFVSVSHGSYVFDPVPYGGRTWEWPPIAVSDGVSLQGEYGDSMVTWCVWLIADAGTVKNWQATVDGVVEGSCEV